MESTAFRKVSFKIHICLLMLFYSPEYFYGLSKLAVYEAVYITHIL